MSLHASIIMINCDVTEKIKSIFETFDYICPESPKLSSQWNEVCDSFTYPQPGKDRNIVSKAVSFINGWSVILDPELVLAIEYDKWNQFAQQFHAPIFTMICEGASGTYSFFYTDGTNARTFFSIAGDTQEDSGKKILQEAGIDLNSIFEDDILLVMEKLGVKFRDIEEATEYQIWELDESNIGPSPEELEKFLKSESKEKVSWWKFWG